MVDGGEYALRRAAAARAKAAARRRVAPLLLAVSALALCATPALAQPDDDVRTTFGDVGLLEMPSAHMAKDGELSATVGLLDDTQRYNFGFQILPWLEASFRYSHIGVISDYDRSFGLKLRLLEESDNLPDISIGIRDLLGTGIYGQEYLVASKHIWDFDATVGMGWGRLSDEAAFENPLGLIFPSFKVRKVAFGQGGTVSFSTLFHGPNVGLFGGVAWQTPIEDLKVLVEYSPDRYKRESANGGFPIRSPVNVGLNYRVVDSMSVSAGWLYGSTYGVSVAFRADPTTAGPVDRIGPDIPPPHVRSDKEQVAALRQLIEPRTRLGATWVNLAPAPAPDRLAVAAALMTTDGGVGDVDVMDRTLLVEAHLHRTPHEQCAQYAALASSVAPRLQSVALTDADDMSGRVTICRIAQPAAFQAEAPAEGVPDAAAMRRAEARIQADVAAQGVTVEAVSVEPDSVWLYFSNARYGNETEAAGRIARVLMSDAPSSAEIFHLTSVRYGLPVREFRIARSALERTTSFNGGSLEMGDAVASVAPPLNNPVLDRAFSESYPRFHWSIAPGLREGFFDPHRPLQVEVFGALAGSVDIFPELTLEGRGEVNIYNDFRPQGSNSVLPHVRSDFGEFFRQGANGIANLDAVYHTRLSREFFFEAKAGYLESMFAGGGAQLLWRPEGSRFAVGADLYEVWKRNFDRLFGLQNYHVLTGHVTLYYESPWYGLNFAVHGGRYLAGDYGGTIEVSRRFETGVEVGAFATFTNVPFSKFGEGSFDKGIIVRIPLEWALPIYTQTTYDLELHSIARDGGQRLIGDDSLYDETRPTSYGEVFGHADQIISP